MVTGEKPRKLVVVLERGDLISIRKHRCRNKHTVRLYDVFWWMLRSESNKVHMEKLREIKARKSARLADQRERREVRWLFSQTD